MERYYLAIDIGASGGRHMLAKMENGRLELTEAYRFQNGVSEIDGQLCWDLDRLFKEIIAGMKKCGEMGIIPYSVGIDTWGVDFVLLDKNDNRIGNAVSYRDDRTKGMDKEVYSVIAQAELYKRTGIQKQLYNTIYQLMALKKTRPQMLNQAESMLMLPDYFHFLLTGIKREEYTIASTSQLVSPISNDWDYELISALGYPKRLFQPIAAPGSLLGEVTAEIAKEIGYSCKVILPPAHDTASAVLAVPNIEGTPLYISSGTWSLMGIERETADCSAESCEHNFTNEGGYNYKYRYLKNIMGMWMIQSVKKELAARGEEYSYDELCEKAEADDINSIIDCENERFLAPKSMIDEIGAYCRETNQPQPVTAAELARVIYRSLAKSYALTKRELEQLSGERFNSINIVGGGSKAEYLDRLTAKECDCVVYAGPTEGTAIGNIMAQMLSDNAWRTVEEARKCVFDSFGCKTYENK